MPDQPKQKGARPLEQQAVEVHRVRMQATGALPPPTLKKLKWRRCLPTTTLKTACVWRGGACSPPLKKQKWRRVLSTPTIKDHAGGGGWLCPPHS